VRTIIIVLDYLVLSVSLNIILIVLLLWQTSSFFCRFCSIFENRILQSTIWS